MNEAYDRDLEKWVFAEWHKPHRASAEHFDTRNAHHSLSVDEKEYSRLVKYRPRTRYRCSYFCCTPRAVDLSGGGGEMTEEHRVGRDILYNRLLKKENIQVRLQASYDCEFDVLCKNCRKPGLRIAPREDILNLRYYDQVLCEKPSFLDPIFVPDILLQNRSTGEELWLEIHNHSAVADNIKKLLSGVPIIEIDCKEEDEVRYISKIETFIEGDKCRIYNPWSLPNYAGVKIPCKKFNKKFDRRFRPQRSKLKQMFRGILTFLSKFHDKFSI